MSGLQGVIIPVALGLVGGVCNYLYLAQQATKMETVSFVTISNQAKINGGDLFRKDQFQPVKIPKNNLGNLDQSGVLWQDREAVVGFRATRSYRGGEILLWQDIKTPSQKNLSERLAENEVARWVPVDTKTFIPERVNPGDRVSFIIANNINTADSLPSVNQAQTEIVGPFRILMLGTRAGDKQVHRAAGLKSGPEHIITISVRYEQGKMEQKAARLFDHLQRTGYKSVQVMLHSAQFETATPLPRKS